MMRVSNRVSNLSYAEQERRVRMVQGAAKRLLATKGPCSRRFMFETDRVADTSWITRALNRLASLGATMSVGAGPARAHKAKDLDMLTRIASDDIAAAGVLWGSLPEPDPESPEDIPGQPHVPPLEPPEEIPDLPEITDGSAVKQLLIAHATAVLAMGERLGGNELRLETIEQKADAIARKLDRILSELGVNHVE